MLPLHPRPIFQKFSADVFERTEGLWAQRNWAEWNWQCREHFVSCQRQRQTISLPYLLIFTSLSLLRIQLFGLLESKAARISLSLLWCFKKNKIKFTLREWQSREANHKENTSPQRGMAHPPKQPVVKERAKEGASFSVLFWGWSHYVLSLLCLLCK